MNSYIANLIRCFSIIIFMLLPLRALHAEPLPSFVFQQYNIVDTSESSLKALVKQGSTNVFNQPRKARVIFIEALERVSRGSKIDNYDYLWTQYGLLKASFESNSNHYGPGSESDYVKVAKNVIAYMDERGSTGLWPFTEEGAFQMATYREAGNGLAWVTMLNTDNKDDLNKALALINKTEKHVRGIQDYYILDTKVRILLKLKMQTEAFKIVKKVLDEDSEFGDFQDFTDDAEYLSWLQKQS